MALVTVSRGTIQEEVRQFGRIENDALQKDCVATEGESSVNPCFWGRQAMFDRLHSDEEHNERMMSSAEIYIQ